MEKESFVWIIDDDKIFRFTTEKYLLLLDNVSRVSTFKYVEDALNQIREHGSNPEELPDVILLDVNMPIMDGWDFVAEYEKLKPDLAKSISIFVVSSSIDERDSERARSNGEVMDYVVKPLDEEQLASIIKRAKQNQE